MSARDRELLDAHAAALVEAAEANDAAAAVALERAVKAVRACREAGLAEAARREWLELRQLGAA